MGRSATTFRVFRAVLPGLFAGIIVLLAATTLRGQSAFDLAGKPADPLQLSAGKVVVLVFVRSDCPVANRYAPTLQELIAAYEGKAAFWLIYPSKTESAESIRKHEREYRYKIPALRDPQHVLVKQSQTTITPEVAVFTADGKLVYHGRIDDLYVDMTRARRAATTHDLDDAIQAALDGRSPASPTQPAIGCYIADLK